MIAGDRAGLDAMLERSRRADPTFLPGILFRYTLTSEYGKLPFREPVTGLPIDRCIAVIGAMTDRAGADVAADARTVLALRAIRGDRDAERCAAAFALIFATVAVERDRLGPGAIYDAVRALAVARDVPRILVIIANLAHSPELPPAVTLVREALARSNHPYDRVVARATLITMLLSGRDTVAARRELQVGDQEVAHDGRPGLLAHWVSVTASLMPQLIPGPGDQDTATQARAATLFQRIGDHHAEAISLRNLAMRAIDHGRPADGLRYAERAVQASARLPTGFSLLQSRVYAGRALVKLGRTEEGIALLRRAIRDAQPTGARFEVASAWHNLAHAYEGAGRWREAAAAADHFVALAAPMRFDGLRVISLYDAATINRSAGWHASAAADFRRMVQVIDDQDANHVWAGEFLERAGELDAALHHFRRGALQESGDPQNEAGITRVYLALGRFDSAGAAARRHDADSAKWHPLEGPLMPLVLQRQGHTAEAAELLQAWTRRRIEAGNVEGGTRAALEEGEAHIAAGNPAAALRAATVAESLGGILHLTSAVNGARILRARGLAAMGWRVEALTTVRSIRLGTDAPVRDRITAATLEGDLLATLGRPGTALDAYARAADIVERVAGRLGEDLDRAGYRGIELAPFDAAISLMLRQGTGPAPILRWSARRKAAALRIGPADPVPPNDLAALQRAVGPRRVLADYIITATTVSAVVVTATTARVVILPVGPDALAALITRYRAPYLATIAGRLDVARIRPDTAAAILLGQLLLAPIAAELKGVEELMVSPDGALGLLPFDLLPGPGGERYLLQRMAVSYAPSTRFVRGAAVKVGGPVLVILGDAPGAANEADGIRAAWPEGSVKVVSGPEATERATLPLRPPGILHVAAHAVSDGIDPWATHLRLASDATDDGYLHVGELSGHRLPALVVLSACSAVPGPIYGAEGPLGLARGFLAGGARRVIGSEWPVGPGAAVFSARLHHYLAAGQSPVQAVRLAKLDLLADPATSNPFHWGTWVVYGG